MGKKAIIANLKKRPLSRNEMVLFVEELKSLMYKHDPIETEVLAEVLLLTLCSFFSVKLSFRQVEQAMKRVVRVYREAHK